MQLILEYFCIFKKQKNMKTHLIINHFENYYRNVIFFFLTYFNYFQLISLIFLENILKNNGTNMQND